MNKTCKAGMVYDEIDDGHKVPYRKGLPCFKPDGVVAEQCFCPNLRFKTEEEIQQELDSWEAETNKVMVALKVIAPIRKTFAGKDWSGVLECPNCKGKLHVSHSKLNGHIHAKCETEGCVSWME